MAPPATDTAEPPRRVGGGLRLRLLSAAVLIPLVIGAVWIGGIAFAVLVLLAAFAMHYEWSKLAGAFGPLEALAFLPVAAAIGLAAAGAAIYGLGALLVGAILALARPWLGVGILYVGLPCVSMIWLRGDGDNGFALIVWLLVVVWATDTGAYAVGRWLGGPKLAPAVSPNKTWSGSIGGLITGLVGGIVAAALFGQGPMGGLVLWSLVLALVAEIGDLVESAIKRRFDVKDAGALIPGHGGALDRLDSLLLAAPAAALILLIGGSLPEWQ